jgi:hypothetical protein
MWYTHIIRRMLQNYTTSVSFRIFLLLFSVKTFASYSCERKCSYRSCNKPFLQEYLYQDVFGALKHLKIWCNAVVWQMWKVGDFRPIEGARYLFKKKNSFSHLYPSKFQVPPWDYSRTTRGELATVALVSKNVQRKNLVQYIGMNFPIRSTNTEF